MTTRSTCFLAAPLTAGHPSPTILTDIRDAVRGTNTRLDVKLPRRGGQSHYAASFLDCNLKSNSIGLTSPMLE